MALMRIAVFHNGPLLQALIETAWDEAAEPSPRAPNEGLKVTLNPPLNTLALINPDLVLVVCDMPSPTFEGSVLEKCRELRLMVLPVQGRASTVLFGPLEVPGQSGCVTCLQLRWDHSMRRTKLNAALVAKIGDAQPTNNPLSLTESERRVVADAVVEEIRGIMVGRQIHTKGEVGIYRRGECIEWVPLVPSHACPRCNTLLDDDPAFGHLNFESHPIEQVDALRVTTLDPLLLKRAYVHSDLGYVSSVHNVSADDRYVTASAQIQSPFGRAHVGYGSGPTFAGAQQMAILEAVERTCAVECTNRRPVVWGSYVDLRERSFDPLQCGVHDAIFYLSHAPQIVPFDEEQPYSWIWAYSTRRCEPILIPEQIAHYGQTRDTTRFVKESSNGCALGSSVEEAVLHGIFEVLERDGFLNMWYGRLPVPELQVGPGCPEDVQATYAILETNGYQVRLFDVSHDLTMPAILAVAVGSENHVPRVACGASCHLNPYEAVNHALRELTVQVLHLESMSDRRRQEAVSMLQDPTKIREILDHVVVAALPEALPRWHFLLNGKRHTPIRSIEEVYSDVRRRYRMDTKDILVVLNAVLEDLHQRGFDVVVVNQTNVEAAYGGFHAVKVIIPGMTPITFGYGCQRVEGLSRVYELPYKMGYTSHPLTVDTLNKDCHPFA